jgi:hypothetical protein
VSFDSYLLIVGSDGISFCSSLFRNCPTLTAENLFPREQLALALFRECKKKAQRRAAADRFAFAKTHTLLIGAPLWHSFKPATLIGRHRGAFRRFWKSRSVERPQ